jgi:hypothetical protein
MFLRQNKKSTFQNHTRQMLILMLKYCDVKRKTRVNVLHYKCPLKTRLSVYQDMNTYKSVEVQRHAFLTLAHQLHPSKTLRFSFNRKTVEPYSRYGRCEGHTKFHPCQSKH